MLRRAARQKVPREWQNNATSMTRSGAKAIAVLLFNCALPIGLWLSLEKSWPFRDSEAWALFALVLAPVWTIIGVVLSLDVMHNESSAHNLGRVTTALILVLLVTPLALGLEYQSLSPFGAIMKCRGDFCLPSVLAVSSYLIAAFVMGCWVFPRLRSDEKYRSARVWVGLC
jgi:hypothetical protein